MDRRPEIGRTGRGRGERRLRRRIGAPLLRTAALLLALANASPARPEDRVPAEMQAVIVVKMLGYDRALRARAGASIEIGVVYDPQHEESTRVHAQVLAAFKKLESKTVRGTGVTAEAHAFSGAGHLREWVTASGIDVIYVAPGLARELPSIRAMCRERKIASVTSVRALVEGGVAVGVVVAGRNPRLLVNLAAARESGMDLDAKLLHLSELVR